MTPALELQDLGPLLTAVRAQLETALWLSAGMTAAFAGIVSIAFGWRRPALAFGLLYSSALCFVPGGPARWLGPAGAAVALAGLIWPGKSRRRP